MRRSNAITHLHISYITNDCIDVCHICIITDNIAPNVRSHHGWYYSFQQRAITDEVPSSHISGYVYLSRHSDITGSSDVTDDVDVGNRGKCCSHAFQ